jgi:2-C-methyl-D-erythritol 4-phosphate cytidylyltransferase
MSYVTAIVLAAGRGERFGSKTPKLLAKIGLKPIIIHTLEVLSRHSSVRDIILVVNPGNSKELIAKIEQYRIGKISGVVEGGLRRQDSLGNGLRVIDSRTDLVLIHDAARPFIDRKTISSVIAEAKRSGAAIVGVPVKATIKEVSGLRSQVQVKKTLDRRKVWEIQTPQVFKKGLILKAYKRFGKIDVTDDAMLVEKLGKKVNIVKGSYCNIKITTPEDLILAKAIAKRIR